MWVGYQETNKNILLSLFFKLKLGFSVMVRFYFMICALLISVNLVNAPLVNAKHLEISQLQWETSNLLSPTYFIEHGYNCFAYNFGKEQQIIAHQCETQGILDSERLWVLQMSSENHFTLVRCRFSSNCNATHLEILSEFSNTLSIK